MSTDYAFSRQYGLAEQYGQQALTSFRATNAPPKFQAAALNVLGMIAWWRGQLDYAETQLRQAAFLWRELGQLTELLRTLNNLMGILKAAGKYEAVRLCYAEAVTCFPHIASEFEKIVTEVGYGGALFEQGHYQEAEAVFHRANSIYLQQSGHLYYQAIVAQCLGNTLLKQESLDKAASYLKESARLWEKCDDELMRANTLGTIAELYVRQGKTGKAVAFFDQALAILGRYPDDAWAKKLAADFTKQLRELK